MLIVLEIWENIYIDTESARQHKLITRAMGLKFTTWNFLISIRETVVMIATSKVSYDLDVSIKTKIPHVKDKIYSDKSTSEVLYCQFYESNDHFLKTN